MGKSKATGKGFNRFFDDYEEDDYSDRDSFKDKEFRRKQRKMKNALKSRNIDELNTFDEED